MTNNEIKIKIANNHLVATGQRFWTASVVGLIVTWLVWPYFPARWALAAGAGYILACHILSVINWFFWRDEMRDARPDFWESWLLLGNFSAGIIGGTINALLYLYLPSEIRPYLLLFATLLIGAWSMANIPHMKCVYAFFLSALTPLVIVMIAQDSALEYTQVIILMIFFLGIVKHARQVSTAYRASIDQISGLQRLAETEAQNKELLSAAYARQSAMLDSIPVPIIVNELSNGKLLYYNSATTALTGLTSDLERETLLSEDYFVDPEKWRKLAEEIRQKGLVRDFELHLKRPDGSTFWAFYSASLFEYQGKPAIIGTFNDITSRLEAEDARRLSEEKLLLSTEQNNSRLRDLLDSVPVPIVVSKQEDGIILYMNRVALDVAGIKSLSEIPGVRGTDFFADPAEADRLGRRIQTEKTISEEEYRNIEFQLKRGDGTSMWVFYSANQMMYENQPAIIGTFSDITARRQAEEELRKSEIKFRLLADHASDLISIFSLDGLCTYVSPSIERTLGYRQDEFLGHSLYKFAHPDDVVIIHSNNMQSMKSGVVPKPYIFRIRHKEGHWEWLEGSSSVEKNPDTGEFIQISSVSRLVTERIHREQELKEARERAEAADRAKSDFLAHMSHEIRTPLNAVIGFSEVMRDQLFGPLGSPRYLEYINDIHNSGTHLLELINDVLDLSKIEAGKFDLQEDRIQLNTIIDTAFRFVHDRADAKLISLQSILHVTPDIWCDRRVFTQVMLNLIGNAIKFTPEKGRITVESHIDNDGNLVLSVTDTGVGISESDIPIVMKPFGQARASSDIANAEPGTGLGLPLSKSFVEKHGGTLTITSEVGVGTRVSVTIPASRIMNDQDGTGFVSAVVG